MSPEEQARVMVTGAGRLPRAMTTGRRVEAALCRFFESQKMRVRRMVPARGLDGKPGEAGSDPFVEFSYEGGESEINLAHMAAFLVEELEL